MQSIVRTSLAVACLSVLAGTASTADRIYLPGHGVSLPVVIREVKAAYPPEALKSGIWGSVMLECVVRPNGTVGRVRVVKSLDTRNGFDRAAVRAMKQWRFKPGLKDGKPVAVRIDTEMTFTTK